VKVGVVLDAKPVGFVPAAGQRQLMAGVPLLPLMLQPGCAVVTGEKPVLAS
jgi:hypothetical protein